MLSELNSKNQKTLVPVVKYRYHGIIVYDRDYVETLYSVPLLWHSNVFKAEKTPFTNTQHTGNGHDRPV